MPTSDPGKRKDASIAPGARGDKKAQTALREELKARIMLSKSDSARSREESGKAWVACSPHEFHKAVQGLAAGISSVAGPRPGLHADLVDLAAAMADAMAKDERISKLKSLENCIDGVSEENPKEFLYLLARLHPRLRERTQLIITEHLVPCSVCLNPKDFKRLVHFFRVFYEARTKGFDLEDAQ